MPSESLNKTRALTRKLHEVPELSVDFTSAVWLSACRSKAIAMDQAGAAGMRRGNRRQTGSGTIVLLIKPEFLLLVIENIK
jgi:hypothetical protein